MAAVVALGEPAVCPRRVQVLCNRPGGCPLLAVGMHGAPPFNGALLYSQVEENYLL